MALGGLDIGTSGCKCTIMTTGGELLASCYRLRRQPDGQRPRGGGPGDLGGGATVIAGACAKAGSP